MITLEQYQNPRELARIAHFVDTDHHRGDAKRLYPDKTSVIRGVAVPGGGSSRRYSWEAHQGMRRSGAPCRPRHSSTSFIARTDTFSWNPRNANA